MSVHQVIMWVHLFKFLEHVTSVTRIFVLMDECPHFLQIFLDLMIVVEINTAPLHPKVTSSSISASHQIPYISDVLHLCDINLFPKKKSPVLSFYLQKSNFSKFLTCQTNNCNIK